MKADQVVEDENYLGVDSVNHYCATDIPIIAHHMYLHVGTPGVY